MANEFIDFAVAISEGHPGVATGLALASRVVPVPALQETVLATGKRGQNLYNLYGDWLRADNNRFKQNPDFAAFLIGLVDGEVTISNGVANDRERGPS